MSAPIPAEQLADIRRRNDISLRLAENPTYALDQAEDDRRLLLAEVDRLNRLATVQSDMISEITAACMATETERDQYRKQAVLLGKHLQGGSKAFIDALGEADRLRAELDGIRARALARNDQLLAARDRCPYDDRVRRRAYEQSAAELRALIDGIGDGRG